VLTFCAPTKNESGSYRKHLGRNIVVERRQRGADSALPLILESSDRGARREGLPARRVVASSFDFELACRTYGRNDAFWVLCYRAAPRRRGSADRARAAQARHDANRATGGLNRRASASATRATRRRRPSSRSRATRSRPGCADAARAPALGVGEPLAYAHPAGEKPARGDLRPGRSVLGASRRSGRRTASSPRRPAPGRGVLPALQPPGRGQVFRLGFTPCYQGRAAGYDQALAQAAAAVPRALCIWILYDGLWEDVYDYFSDV
jgi:hypothetical protein